jgi:hypothetical protein
MRNPDYQTEHLVRTFVPTMHGPWHLLVALALAAARERHKLPEVFRCATPNPTVQ